MKAFRFIIHMRLLTLAILCLALFVMLIPAPTHAQNASSIKFSFAVISDLHNAKKCDTSIGPHARAAVEAINHIDPAPDFVVGVGDLIAGGVGCGSGKNIENQWNTFDTEILKNLRSPFVPVSGNHDLKEENQLGSTIPRSQWDTFWADHVSEVLPAAATASGFPNSYRFSHEGIGFSIIDYGNSWGIRDTELQWTQANVGSGDMVFHHVNPFGVGCFKSGYCGFAMTHNENDPDDFVAALKNRNAGALFSGHSHAFYDGTCDDLRFINTGALGQRLQGYTKDAKADTLKYTFVLVQVLHNNEIQIIFYNYNSGKFTPFDVDKFPKSITVKEQKPKIQFWNSTLTSGTEGVDATCITTPKNPILAAASLPIIGETALIIEQPQPLITIPGLSFSDPKDLKRVDEGGNRYIYIPFLGEYIAAIYVWAIAAVGIIAVAVIILSGFQWMLPGNIIAGSGDQKQTQNKAKKRIAGAVTGLLIAVTSYVLLYTINPALVEFQNLKVITVKGDSTANHDAIDEKKGSMCTGRKKASQQREKVSVNYLAALEANACGNRPLDMIKYLVIHEGGGHNEIKPNNKRGGLDSTTYILKKRGLSTHYIIRRDGTILNTVDIQRIAYHAGGINRWSIGVDMSIAPKCTTTKVGKKASEPCFYTDLQYDALKKLIAELVPITAIKWDDGHIIGHREISGNRADPRNFIWEGIGLHSANHKARNKFTDAIRKQLIAADKEIKRTAKAKVCCTYYNKNNKLVEETLTHQQCINTYGANVVSEAGGSCSTNQSEVSGATEVQQSTE